MADYASRERDIRLVRDEVFLREQQISRELELDDRDECCSHVIIYNDGQPTATGRIDLAKGGKVGRVAVVPTHRRSGLGSMVMHALEAFAWQQGLDRVWFNAQASAVPFYLWLGYEICSEEFMEAGIPHVMMQKFAPADPSRADID